MVDVRVDYGDGQEQRVAEINEEEFDKGPKDGNGDYMFDDFASRDKAGKRREWKQFMENLGSQERQALIDSDIITRDVYANQYDSVPMERLQVVYDTSLPTNRQANVCLRAVRWIPNNPKASAGIFGAILFVAVATGGSLLAVYKPWRKKSNPVKKTRAENLDKDGIRAYWTPADTGTDADKYTVTLTDTSTNTAVKSGNVLYDPSKQEYMHDFTGVAIGTYTVSVVATNDLGSSDAVTSGPVTISTTATVSKPGAPASVELQLLGMMSIEVSWETSNSGDPATSFKVDLKLGNQVRKSETVAGTERSVRFPTLPVGTYGASVYATNSAGSSQATDGAPTIKISTPAMLQVPLAPENLVAAVDGTKITVSWSQPSAGDAATSYNVEAIGTNGGETQAVEDVMAPPYTFGNLVPGNYTIKVTSVNTKGAGAAASSAQLTVKPADDNNPVDDNVVVDDQVTAFWQTEFNKLANLDEASFWQPVIQAVVTGGSNNTKLSYEDQHVLVMFLIAITPPLPKRESGYISKLATKISNDTTPTFPRNPPPAGTPDFDPDLVWTTASTLRTENNRQEEERYYKLIGLERAIKRYRGL